jgi:hypothetical protein
MKDENKLMFTQQGLETSQVPIGQDETLFYQNIIEAFSHPAKSRGG